MTIAETMEPPTPQTTVPSRRRGLLAEPTYGWGEIAPRKPTIREVFVEWFDAINFIKDPAKTLTAAFTAFHIATFGVFIYFFANYFSIKHVALVMGLSAVIATIYNTVWYHRYCTHRAYKFRNRHWTKLFLWSNPVCFREESYVIPHHVHHSKEDRPGDPYGPHLGWLGSYLASESSAKTNLNINRSDYERLSRGLSHIGFPANTYEDFQRTGSVEKAWHYLARCVVANLFWATLAYLIGGKVAVLTWYSGIFLYTFFVRDFNYRGHGGFLFKATKGHAANQLFYGLIGGEWHENHHANPRLAHSGFAWWQLDIPFYLIKLMQWSGMVDEVNTLQGTARTRRPRFETEVNPAT